MGMISKRKREGGDTLASFFPSSITMFPSFPFGKETQKQRKKRERKKELPVSERARALGKLQLGMDERNERQAMDKEKGIHPRPERSIRRGGLFLVLLFVRSLKAERGFVTHGSRTGWSRGLRAPLSPF